MNIKWSAAITSIPNYGYMYDTNLYALNDDGHALGVKKFMKQMEKDFQIYHGLYNDITKEQKRAKLMLDVEHADGDNHIKKIFADRIARKKQIFDLENVMTELVQRGGRYTHTFIELSGLTTTEAYKQVKQKFEPLLNHIKEEIDEQWPVDDLKSLAK